jgi:hypothetical protein
LICMISRVRVEKGGQSFAPRPLSLLIPEFIIPET